MRAGLTHAEKRVRTASGHTGAVTSSGDFGFLSDCHGSALVDRDATVVWWAVPRFDSPAVFTRLLGVDAGHWSLHPIGTYERTRGYVGETLVLRTAFRTGTGRVSVTDALALEPGARGHDVGRRAPHVLVRLVEGLDGTVELTSQFTPRMEYGRTAPRIEVNADGLVARAGADTLRVVSDVSFVVEGDGGRATFTVRQGQKVGLSCGWASTWSRGAPQVRDAAAAVADTQAAWESWIDEHDGYRGHAREAVRRSAVVLRGLTYEPSGAVVAAATTSLPEQPGGDANWDYRYVWLRDVALTMQALWVAACPSEANRFLDFIATSAGGSQDGVQIVYGVDGRRDLTEHELDHLGGFAGSTPVRVGNDAWRQRQLDVMGEVLDAAYLLRDQLGELDDAVRELLVGLVERAAAQWSEPDAGMWEARDRRRHYLTSKVLCWVALDRGLRMARRLGVDGDEERLERWRSERDRVREAVLERGWSGEAGAYTGAFGSDRLDASVLLLPIVGFLPADDERMWATITAIETQLADAGRGVVERWAGEGAGFVLCGYWLVECLALAGETDRAAAWFDTLTAGANDLGLLAEMTDPGTGEPLGNVPQAFSHVGLVNAAWRLTQVLEGADLGDVAD